VVYIRALGSLERADLAVGSGGISASLYNENFQINAIDILHAWTRGKQTCENGDAWLGTTRKPRKHWREGATKARAEIIVK
jgi:hypothetical protein